MENLGCEQINVKPADGEHNYIVTEDYTYKDIVIPVGYKTNGADVPRPFWVYIPPFGPKRLTAIVIHDYLCDKGEFKKADDYLEEVLKILTPNSRKSKIMVKAVRAYHRLKYGVKSEK